MTTPVPPPETYFTGKQLELAQIIDKADAQKVYQFAKTLNKDELDFLGNQKMTVLFYATQKASVDPKWLPCITALVKAGADPLLQSYDDISLMEAAVARSQTGPSNPDILKAALDGGVNPNTIAFHGGETPIISKVASQDSPALLHLLVERGANVNAKDSSGQTALFSAISTFSLDEVNYLLDRGADPKAIDDDGLSFAALLNTHIERQKSDSRYSKLLAIRDRIIKAGVKWPPLTFEQEQERLRAEAKARGETLFFPGEEGYVYKPFVYKPDPVPSVK